ncbi:MAG: M67 family metallopeptidase [Pacificimonas sp.]
MSFETLRLASAAVATMRDEARKAGESECCGLLLGEGGVVTDARPTSNVADDPSRRFEIDPAALFAAHRAARDGGPKVLGHYHSHPTGSPAPSANDAVRAQADGAIWIIVANGNLLAWRAGDAGLHDRFRPMDIIEEAV